MYARTVQKRTLTFAVSGFLWNSSLVMVDLETNSYWSHLLGTAMRGPLEGEQLEVFPSTITDWATWREKYADTTVAALSRTTSVYHRMLHQSDEHLLIGLADKSGSRFWYFDALRENPIVNDEFSGQPIVVCYDPPSGTAVIFSREANGKTLTFEGRDGELVDQETGARWDRVTGKAIGGGLQDVQLAKLPAVVSLDRAWATFYPDSKPGHNGLVEQER